MDCEKWRFSFEVSTKWIVQNIETIDIMVCISNINSFRSELMKKSLLLILGLLLTFGTIAHGDRLIPYSKSTEISKSSESIVDDVSQGIYRVLSADKSVLDKIYDVNSYSILYQSGVTYGSGFLIADDLLLTDEHVIRGSHTVLILSGTDSTKMFYGEVVKVDKDLDLAIIKLPKQDHKILKFGSVEYGTNLISLGFVGWGLFPQKLEITGHEGKVIFVLYKLGSDGNTLRGAVNTTAEHGMSGGPIINLKGEVIGTNDFIMENKTTAFTRSEDIKVFIQSYTDSLKTEAQTKNSFDPVTGVFTLK